MIFTPSPPHPHSCTSSHPHSHSHTSLPPTQSSTLKTLPEAEGGDSLQTQEGERDGGEVHHLYQVGMRTAIILRREDHRWCKDHYCYKYVPHSFHFMVSVLHYSVSHPDPCAHGSENGVLSDLSCYMEQTRITLSI